MSDEERTLDQFAETDDRVEPAATTHAFDPDGGACGVCGATVDRRWRQDDALVCADCKRWTSGGAESGAAESG